jgi:hypothetical protein
MPIKRKSYHLDQSPFYKLNSKKKLARLLHLDIVKLNHLSSTSDNCYSEFPLKKKSLYDRYFATKEPKSRLVENPNQPLKVVQKRISELMAKIVAPHFLFCPAKGKSYLSNAALHSKARVVKTLDIQKYFPSTSSKRVYWFFHSRMLCSKDVAATLTRLICYKGHLPTGASTSPIMSYFANIDAFQAIAGICELNSITVSIYVDDITLSGDRVPDAVVWQVKREIKRVGLSYHKEKWSFEGQIEVTGSILGNGRIVPPNRQLLKLHKVNERLKAETSEGVLRHMIVLRSSLRAQLAQIVRVN